MTKLIKIRTKISGFTLIELLVVISVIGLLASIFLVSFTNARKKARIGVARANVRQLATGFAVYFDRYGQYPPQKYVNGVLTPADHCDYCGGASYGSYALNTWDDVIDVLTQEKIMDSPRLDPWGQPYIFDNNYKQDCFTCHTSPLCSVGENGVFESHDAYYSANNPHEDGDDICTFLEGNP